MSFETVVEVIVGALVLYLLARTFLGKVAPERARSLVEGGALLVDVRSESEFDAGHLEGALNIPVSELSQRIGELGNKESPIVLYCASGARSAAAASTLKRAGFLQVFDLGAKSRWLSAPSKPSSSSTR